MSATTTTSGNARPAFVGRADALALLADALDAARQDGGRAVVVTGEAGIGKSALLAEFGRQVADEAVVLTGSAATMDRAVPYAPIAQAVRQLLRPLDEPARRTLLGPVRGEIARLLPSLGLASTREDDDAEDDARLRLHTALLDLLERAADPALVLVVEDVHWADASTIDLVSGLLSSLGEAPVLVVASFRTDELRPTHPVRAALLEWERHPRVDRLELGRLPDADLHKVVGTIAGDDVSLARQAVERAGGNPFVALELTRAGTHGALPTGLREAVLLRLGLLSPTTQDLVRAAAANGPRVGHDLLEAVVDLRPSELRPALREAIDAHFLDVDDDTYAFRHALMAEVLHDDLLPGERRDVHRRYADALDDVPALSGRGRAAALAEHRLLANDLDGAFTASLDAARESREVGALADAAMHLARAADLWDTVPAAAAAAGIGRGALLLQAAEVAAAAAQPDACLGHADRALAVFEQTDDDIGAALSLRWRAAALYQLGRPGMREAYEAALARLPDDAVRERAEVLGAHAKGLALLGRVAEAEPLAREALAVVEQHGRPDEVLWSRQSVAGIAAYLGQTDEALAIYRELADTPLSTREGCAVHTNYSDTLDALGMIEESLAVVVEGIDRIGGQVRGDKDAFLALNAAEASWKLGRFDETRHWLRTASRPADGVARLHRVLNVARLRLEADGTAAAEGALATATRLGAAAHVGPQFSAVVAALRAQAALLDGDAHEALRLATEGLEVGHEHSGRHRYSGRLLHLATCAAVLIGDAAQVAGTLDTIATFAGDGRGTTPEWDAWTALARAEASRLDPDGHVGPGDVGTWHLAHDLAVTLGHEPMRWEVARRLGEALLASGDRDGAEKVLVPAMASASRAGAVAAVVLRNVAQRGRLVAGSGDGELTPRELEVLALIAKGRTNREIGDELFITEKTASTHVSNLLRKLGVDNRAAAASTAVSRGLVPG